MSWTTVHTVLAGCTPHARTHCCVGCIYWFALYRPPFLPTHAHALPHTCQYVRSWFLPDRTALSTWLRFARATPHAHWLPHLPWDLRTHYHTSTLHNAAARTHTAHRARLHTPHTVVHATPRTHTPCLCHHCAPAHPTHSPPIPPPPHPPHLFDFGYIKYTFDVTHLDNLPIYVVHIRFVVVYYSLFV